MCDIRRFVRTFTHFEECTNIHTQKGQRSKKLLFWWRDERVKMGKICNQHSNNKTQKNIMKCDFEASATWLYDIFLIILFTHALDEDKYSPKVSVLGTCN